MHACSLIIIVIIIPSIRKQPLFNAYFSTTSKADIKYTCIGMVSCNATLIVEHKDRPNNILTGGEFSCNLESVNWLSKLL